MTTTHVSLSAQELSRLYEEIYCAVAILVLLIYDWLLCLDQEVRLIWDWHHRGVTISSVVYAFIRYAWIIEILFTVLSAFPMSDLSCRADVWIQVVMAFLGLIASSTFSALRAYALSNRSMWLAAIIVLLVLPTVATKIAETSYETPVNLPSPLNCSASSSVPQSLFMSGPIFARASQLVAELLVIGITWWYTYQSHRLRRGITLGKTVSSLLFYNGSMYFLCLATLYTLDIIFITSPAVEPGVVSSFDLFIDPITSILICRFMLSLRQFDSTAVSMASSGLGPQFREHMALTVLEFGAQPSDSLPALISSFARPVHIDASLFEANPDLRLVDNRSHRQTVDGYDVVSAVAEDPSRLVCTTV